MTNLGYMTLSDWLSRIGQAQNNYVKILVNKSLLHTISAASPCTYMLMSSGRLSADRFGLELSPEMNSQFALSQDSRRYAALSSVDRATAAN